MKRQIIFIIIGIIFLGIAIFLAIDLGQFMEKGKEIKLQQCLTSGNPNLYPDCKK